MKISDEVHREQKRAEELVREAQERKKQYFKNLSDQIHLNNKKKTYSILMTEHERKVNDNDIKAYENVDTKHLYALVPGFDSYNKQQEYIDKSMKLARNDNVVIGQNRTLDHNSTPLNKDINSSRNSLGLNTKNHRVSLPKNPVEKTQIMNEFNYSPHKLEKVKRNMEAADRGNFRNSTINRSYGVVPVSDYHPRNIS